MKKNSLLFTLFFVIYVISQAQQDSTAKKQIFHGVVKDEKNKPVQNASVMVQSEDNGTVTDSLGYFKIAAKPDAVLIVNAEGYETLLTPIGKDELIRLIMKKSRTLNNSNVDDLLKQQSASNDFKNYLNSESSKNYTGSYLTVFKNKDETVGSRFLFDHWVNDKLIDKKGQEINTVNCLFNYDKISGKLLATLDKKTIIEIEDSSIRQYSLLPPGGNEIRFKKILNIDDKYFLIQLVDGENKNYSLYKSLRTQFVKADFTTNGLIQSGKKYDEYVDKVAYYIGVPGMDVFTKLELKEKQIKKVLIKEEKQVKAFFDMHREDDLNESFLIQLILTINR